MTILTIAKYLIGDRGAIEQIAGNRWSIWIGLLLVLSAGFAREYDGEDLLNEPWHLLLPLGASLATATVLYGLLWLVLRGWKTYPTEGASYGEFLALYWTTAPLAWLYAIPVERFLDPVAATQANLWFLAIVAVWRVVLITRAASVVFQASFVRVFFPVMLFADTVMMGALLYITLPLLAIMGGVRLSPSQDMIFRVTDVMAHLGLFSWPVWAFGTVASLLTPHKSEEVRPPDRSGAGVRPSAWALAIGLLIFGLALLPFTQPEQQRRWRAEQLLKGGRVEQGLDYMSRFRQEDFPPHWDPPPRVATPGEVGPPMDEVVDKLLRSDRPQWISEIYVSKFRDSFVQENFWVFIFWNQLSDDEFDRYVTFLEKNPLDGTRFDDQVRGLEHYNSDLPKRSPEQLARLKKALGIQDVDIPSKPPAGEGNGDPAKEPFSTEPASQ